jgi:dihydropteroate synthase
VARVTNRVVGPVGLPAHLSGLDRALVMGVLNVTPDSFSDGGRYLEVDAALAHGRELAAAGADLVDVGGESTRPGAHRVDEGEELARVLPVVRGLAADGVAVSIDTMRASVATAAVEAGAVLVNDVSGGLADPAMLDAVAAAGVPYVAMHWRGHSDRMVDLAQYDDVVADVRGELAARLDAAIAAGVDRDRIVLDPGIGFAKDGPANWALLAHLVDLAELGRPLLVGVSRKRFLGELLADLSAEGSAEPPPAHERDLATSVLSGMCAGAGAWAVRVHDVRGAREAVAVAAALYAAGGDR